LADFGLRLAVCGRTADGAYTLDTAMSASGVSDGVVDLGYVPNNELSQVMAGARLFVFPSLAEGFGRPILEAMASGVPVVASDIAAHREVSDEAVELADPSDVEAVAEAMRKVLAEDEADRADRRKKGLARAAEFAPSRFAADVLNVYSELLKGQDADSH